MYIRLMIAILHINSYLTKHVKSGLTGQFHPFGNENLILLTSCHRLLRQQHLKTHSFSLNGKKMELV